jgi:hypothetical protein
MRHLNKIICALLLLGSIGFSQSQAQQASESKNASVTFRFLYKQMHPARYEIIVHSDGSASYESQDDAPIITASTSENPSYQKPKTEEPQSGDSDEIKGDIYHRNFQITPSLKARIFDLAKLANYFDGDFDFRKHNVAFTGKKTLVYSDGARSTQATYNWSENQAINELTDIFNRISQTFEFGQRLAFEYRFQKLELDKELGTMEEIAKRGGLAELHVTVPLLQQLSTDHSVMHVARERAARLLKRAEPEQAELGPPAQ